MLFFNIYEFEYINYCILKIYTNFDINQEKKIPKKIRCTRLGGCGRKLQGSTNHLSWLSEQRERKNHECSSALSKS